MSAPTAYDQATESFGCHASSHEHPQTCAGFLLNGAADNLKVRMAAADGRVHFDRLDDTGLELYGSYREMAVANGVDPQDPALARCEPEHKQRELTERIAERVQRRALARNPNAET